MTQVLANATVDIITPSNPKQAGQFKVHVWGKEPYNYEMDYVITAISDIQSAQQGIQTFVKDAQALGPKGTA